MRRGRGRPANGNVVTYTVGQDAKARARAEKVTISGTPKAHRSSRRTGRLSYLLPLLAIAIVGGSVLLTELPSSIFALYVVVSLLTFLAYAKDKAAARNGRWRTPEATLHMLALVGGWPGAWMAQKALRHKTRKTSFRVVFWLTAALNVAGFVWLHTPDGRDDIVRVLTNIL